ncbi:stage V sporulation protein AE [Terrilactibacillus sp. BCM23-1]|uniref:Stage V sporulation protein AE n=1 Tax=Terrilactibacillus tamarindi TaxID=2599694 RepID=A0A6N8CNS2_9BACI|nr:stage V sporulation protein AE [Terrilactibacillus tamarindi]MTT31230.1 stage V sporulation protein AE [Terrilactibacillus tamarindi]
MSSLKNVILITDGDQYAREAVEHAAKMLHCRCISQSAGNPTVQSGEDIVDHILKTPTDPVLVMFDDSGFNGKGHGEQALEYVAKHKSIHVLGVLAVASNSANHEWTRVDVSIDNTGTLTEYGVDKEGLPDLELGRISGDTVYVLDRLRIPLIVGIGDLGKMRGMDTIEQGAPITVSAIKLILERSGYHDNSNEKDTRL